MRYNSIVKAIINCFYNLLSRMEGFTLKNFKTWLLSALSMVLAISFLLPTHNVSASEPDAVKTLSDKEIQQLGLQLEELYNQQKVNEDNTGTRTKRGVKSKGALKVAELLVKSGDKTVDTLKNLGLLDGMAARSFKARSSKVANFVKGLASAGDDAAAMVRSQLPEQLRKWGLKDKGTREMIANAVSYAIKGADWIFL